MVLRQLLLRPVVRLNLVEGVGVDQVQATWGGDSARRSPVLVDLQVARRVLIHSWRRGVAYWTPVALPLALSVRGAHPALLVADTSRLRVRGRSIVGELLRPREPARIVSILHGFLVDVAGRISDGADLLCFGRCSLLLVDFLTRGCV